MATQTRRTTRCSARFFRATITAYMVVACCGLVLWSAVAAHTAISGNGMALNGVSSNGLQANGLHVNGLTSNGLISNGLHVNGFAPNATILHGEPTPGVQGKSLPWSTLSQRALGEAAAPSMRADGYTPPVELPEVR